jgi:hypothetical protein
MVSLGAIPRSHMVKGRQQVGGWQGDYWPITLNEVCDKLLSHCASFSLLSRVNAFLWSTA